MLQNTDAPGVLLKLLQQELGKFHTVHYTYRVTQAHRCLMSFKQRLCSAKVSGDCFPDSRSKTLWAGQVLLLLLKR
jgi:hypothetical protein